MDEMPKSLADFVAPSFNFIVEAAFRFNFLATFTLITSSSFDFIKKIAILRPLSRIFLLPMI